MRVVRERSPWAQLGAVTGACVLGPFSALRTSLLFAPESDLLQIVAVLSFASVFLVGAFLWMGLGVATVVLRALWNAARGRGLRPARVESGERLVPPGYRSYVFLGMAGGAFVGLAHGVATELGVGASVGLWTVLGTLYGFLLWLAAHHGYLPFPEPE